MDVGPLEQPFTSRRALISSLLLLFVPAAVAQSAPEMDFPQLISAAMREAESGDATAKVGKVDDLRVLAWYRERDNQDFYSARIYLDNALCWARVATEGGSKWALLHMVRHPFVTVAGQSTDWHLHFVYDLCNCWLVYFDHPPNNSDVYCHMRLFRFGPAEDGWVRYDSHVDNDTWAAVIGEAPTKTF
jgi:hypothetical protein